MNHNRITRYYVFSPELSKFISWRGTWVDFQEAQDFTNLRIALDVAKKVSSEEVPVLIFTLPA